jgi:hypothetical protein
LASSRRASGESSGLREAGSVEESAWWRSCQPEPWGVMEISPMEEPPAASHEARAELMELGMREGQAAGL